MPVGQFDISKAADMEINGNLALEWITHLLTRSRSSASSRRPLHHDSSAHSTIRTHVRTRLRRHPGPGRLSPRQTDRLRRLCQAPHRIVPPGTRGQPTSGVRRDGIWWGRLGMVMGTRESRVSAPMPCARKSSDSSDNAWLLDFIPFFFFFSFFEDISLCPAGRPAAHHERRGTDPFILGTRNGQRQRALSHMPARLFVMGSLLFEGI